MFATNTSSLPVVDQAAATSRPGQFVGLHYFNPAQVMKLIEVIRCVTTSDQAFETALEFARSLGKLAIPTRDRAGFIVNRLLVPYMLDAIRAYEEGVGSVVEIDEAMKAGAGHPMGPLLLSDFVGLDTLGSICDVLFDEFRERRFAARRCCARCWRRAGSVEERDGLLRLLGRAARTGDLGRQPGLLGIRADLPTARRELIENPSDRGGPERHREKAREQGKVPVRERVAMLLDEGSFAEEALLANWQEEGLGADGVVTGVGRIDGRTVALMANDPTVKAGSWGPKTVEKILRIQERALELQVPMVYLVDSAGARITDQVQMFPGRRGRGEDLLQPGPPLGGRAAGVRAVRSQRRRGCLHPRLLRHRDHARGERLDVPRLATDGGDGDRRAGEPRGDGRGADAHGRLRVRAPARGQRRGGHRRRPPLPLLPAGQLARSSTSGLRPAAPAPAPARWRS